MVKLKWFVFGLVTATSKTKFSDSLGLIEWSLPYDVFSAHIGSNYSNGQCLFLLIFKELLIIYAVVS